MSARVHACTDYTQIDQTGFAMHCHQKPAQSAKVVTVGSRENTESDQVTLHLEQFLELKSRNVPGGHFVHSAADPEENIPGVHCRHAVALGSLLYIPGLHPRHSFWSTNSPGLQSKRKSAGIAGALPGHTVALSCASYSSVVQL